MLYPFLGGGSQDTSRIVDEVAGSIRAKAADDERLRTEAAHHQADRIAAVIEAVLARLGAGGRLLLFANGGSATDPTEFGLDTVALSDGVMQNDLLLSNIRCALEGGEVRDGLGVHEIGSPRASGALRLWINHQVPANDYGPGLGQAAMALAA